MLRVFIALSVVFATCLSSLPLFAQGIVVYGDTRTDHASHRKVVNAISKTQPSVIFHTGDLVENGRDPEHWAAFNDITSGLLQSVEFYPALGNHEYGSGLFFDNFVLPNNERWYSVEKDGIHFIVLDTTSGVSADSPQYKWLESDLRNRSEKIKFVAAVFHHPPFASCVYHPEDEKGLRDTFVPLFEKYGVDIVFSGHAHAYERSLLNDVYYIISGGGGAPLCSSTRVNPYSQLFIAAYHFCKLSVSGNQLVVSVFDPASELLDQFEVEAKSRDTSE